MAHNTKSDDSSADTKYLIFELGQKEFGIQAKSVEVLKGADDIIRTTDMPGHIIGLTKLWNRKIPLLELRLKFQVAHYTYGGRSAVIVVDVGDGPNAVTIGLVVCGVTEVLEIPEERIKKLTDNEDRIYEPFLNGVVNIIRSRATTIRKILLLDVDKLLTEEELQALKDAKKPDQP